MAISSAPLPVRAATTGHAQVHAVMLAHISVARLLAAAPRFEGKSLSPTRLSPIAKALAKARREPVAALEV